MRYWGYSAPPDELTKVTAAADAFRLYWDSIRPPFPAHFDGTVDDVRALDYLTYEGLGYGKAGIAEAALVCGEVVRKAASLEWAISYRDEWMVATPEDDFPSFAFCPLARLHECECGAGVQFGRHMWVVEQAAFECLLVAGREAEDDIRALLARGAGWRQMVTRTLEALGQPQKRK